LVVNGPSLRIFARPNNSRIDHITSYDTSYSAADMNNYSAREGYYTLGHCEFELLGLQICED